MWEIKWYVYIMMKWFIHSLECHFDIYFFHYFTTRESNTRITMSALTDSTAKQWTITGTAMINFRFPACTRLSVEGLKPPGPWFNIKMSSYQYRKSHCGEKTVVRSSYLHNGISYTGEMTSLYWFSPLATNMFYVVGDEYINGMCVVRRQDQQDEYSLILHRSITPQAS